MALHRNRLTILPLLAGALAAALFPTPGLASGRGRRPEKAPGAGSPPADPRDPAAGEPWPDLALLDELIRTDRLLARPCPRVVGRLAIGADGDLVPAPGGGMAICPGAQLAGRNLRGLLLGRARLKGADLRGADLRGAWLVDADLTEADLTGADLRGAVLTGARLDGARLFMAELRGAVGLDARNAQVHPFLDPEPGAPVGTLRWLQTQEGLVTAASAAPRNPVRAGNGGLYWVAGRRQELVHLVPTGHIAPFERPEAHPSGASRVRIHALAPDGAGGLWQFNDQGPSHYPASGMSVPGFKEGAGFTLELEGKAPHAAAQGPGRAVLTFEHEALFVGMSGGTYTHRSLDCPGDHAFTGSCPGWEGRQLFTAAGVDAILDMPIDLLDVPGATIVPVVLPLPKGSQPLRMVKGPGDKVWATVQNPAGLAVLGPDPRNLAWHPLPRTEPGPEGDLLIERGPRPIFDLTLGPDGNLWFTEPTAGRIGRITPEGKITEFLLPPGFRPLEIAPSDRETLVFTVEGLNLIGSIRAVRSGRPGTGEAAAAGNRDATAGDAGDAKAGTATPGDGKDMIAASGDGKAGAAIPGEAKTGVRERKRTARRKPAASDLTVARLEDPTLRQPAEAPSGPGPAEETKASGREIFLSLREHAAHAAGRGETRPAGARAEARRALADPEAYLRAQDIILTGERIDHILDGHGHDAETDGGRFLEAHSQPGALKALLAQGIADAGGLGPVYDTYGSRYTYCRTGQAGHYRSRGAWHGTDRFVVITWREWNPARGVHEHRIKTAFPCSGNY